MPYVHNKFQYHESLNWLMNYEVTMPLLIVPHNNLPSEKEEHL